MTFRRFGDLILNIEAIDYLTINTIEIRETNQSFVKYEYDISITMRSGKVINYAHQSEEVYRKLIGMLHI